MGVAQPRTPQHELSRALNPDLHHTRLRNPHNHAVSHHDHNMHNLLCILPPSRTLRSPTINGWIARRTVRAPSDYCGGRRAPCPVSVRTIFGLPHGYLKTLCMASGWALIDVATRLSSTADFGYNNCTLHAVSVRCCILCCVHSPFAEGHCSYFTIGTVANVIVLAIESEHMLVLSVSFSTGL